MSKRMGRPFSDDPRSAFVRIRCKPREVELFDAVAEGNRSEFIRQAAVREAKRRLAKKGKA